MYQIASPVDSVFGIRMTITCSVKLVDAVRILRNVGMCVLI